jgi:hypothetical protein
MANLISMLQNQTFWMAATAIVTIVPLFYSISTFSKSLKLAHYAELDKMQFELLSCVLEKPWLEQTVASRPDEQAAAYDIYAWMVWNFVETIYDRCGQHKHLVVTWRPVIIVANSVHGGWFNRPDNNDKFKEKFREFIRNSRYLAPQW